MIQYIDMIFYRQNVGKKDFSRVMVNCMTHSKSFWKHRVSKKCDIPGDSLDEQELPDVVGQQQGWAPDHFKSIARLLLFYCK